MKFRFKNKLLKFTPFISNTKEVEINESKKEDFKIENKVILSQDIEYQEAIINIREIQKKIWVVAPLLVT